MKPYFSAEACSILQGLLCLDVKEFPHCFLMKFEKIAGETIGVDL